MDSLKKIKLIMRTSSVNSLGDVIYAETSREVFGKVASSSQNEWFTAHRDDIKSAFKVVIYDFEYLGEPIVEMDGHRYGVYRTYQASLDKLELYLEDKVGVESAV